MRMSERKDTLQKYQISLKKSAFSLSSFLGSAQRKELVVFCFGFFFVKEEIPEYTVQLLRLCNLLHTFCMGKCLYLK